VQTIFFGVIGPTPVELLANDYRAIYTWPQTTKNEAALVANAAEVERCSGAAKQNSPGADDVLCRIFGATD
jgi:hypothetical protein